MTATPWGFRDILPEEAQAREEIAYTVKGCFREHHYLPVETPLLEDKGSLEEGGRIADTPFKLFDDDGRLLVVRPDNTLPIVRLVSTRMRAADLPLRLRYEAPVVRECQRNAGGSRQFTQLGFELIGAGDTAGDVEIVSLVAETVRELTLPDARIIAGSVRPFKELLAVCEDRELAAETLRTYGELQLDSAVMRCKLYSLLLPAYTILGDEERQKSLIGTIVSFLSLIRAEQSLALLLLTLYGCTDSSIYYYRAHELIDPWSRESSPKKSKLSLIRRLADYDRWLKHNE